MVQNITTLASPEKKKLIRKAIVLGGSILGGVLAFVLASQIEDEDVVEVEVPEGYEASVIVTEKVEEETND